MNDEKANWFSFSLPNSLIIVCANCCMEIDLKESFLDHDSSPCPMCNVECTYLEWKGRKVQIVMPNAKPELVKIIRYLQKNFDELEYVELLACLNEMADAIK